ADAARRHVEGARALVDRRDRLHEDAVLRGEGARDHDSEHRGGCGYTDRDEQEPPAAPRQPGTRQPEDEAETPESRHRPAHAASRSATRQVRLLALSLSRTDARRPAPAHAARGLPARDDPRRSELALVHAFRRLAAA